MFGATVSHPERRQVAGAANTAPPTSGATVSHLERRQVAGAANTAPPTSGATVSHLERRQVAGSSRPHRMGPPSKCCCPEMTPLSFWEMMRYLSRQEHTASFSRSLTTPELSTTLANLYLSKL